jgi:hypothetical protein
MLDDFAVFILTHGRADSVVTYKTLQRAGYTRRVYIVIDNEDDQAEKYYQNFGDKVIMFDKAAIAETFDEGDNFQDRRAIVYARNACFDIAESLGIKYFMQLDDDYTAFDYRFNDFQIAVINPVNSIDSIFASMVEYLKNTPFLSLAFLQGGDMLGGRGGGYAKKIRTYRKAMNTFMCSTSRRFQFSGRINEDVNTYTALQNKGGLLLSLNNVTITQRTTQKHTGGMSDIYLDSGTYIKSFYTVMYQPSSVKVGMMGESHRRLHHSINWDCTVPAIISEQWKK